MKYLKKIWEWIKSLFGGGGGEINKPFPDASKPFLGYGLVNNWSAQNVKHYVDRLVKNNVDCMAFEFFEWSYPEKFANVEGLLKKFKEYIDLAKKKKILLYVTILNSNLGSGKYGDPKIPSNKYTKQIMRAAEQFAQWMKVHPNIFVTPCGEGGIQEKMASHDRKIQEWCKANMPRNQLVNNWGARPSSKDGMGFLCQHPSSTKANAQSWVMSDHGKLIAELNGGHFLGTCDYKTTLAYAKKLLKEKKTFIYYHFNKNGVIDEEALRALKDAKG